MIYVLTGNGKGKTTSAMGQILRSLGQGLKVCLIQLFKGTAFYGEQKLFKKLNGLTFYSFAPKHPGCFPTVSRDTVRQGCAQALDCFKRASVEKYDLIVLEEFNIAMRDAYLETPDVIKALKKLDKNKHVFITGRGAPKELVRLADLVTEMKEVKHPYKKGIQAKKGIEF